MPQQPFEKSTKGSDVVRDVPLPKGQFPCEILSVSSFDFLSQVFIQPSDKATKDLKKALKNTLKSVYDGGQVTSLLPGDLKRISQVCIRRKDENGVKYCRCEITELTDHEVSLMDMDFTTEFKEQLKSITLYPLTPDVAQFPKLSRICNYDDKKFSKDDLQALVGCKTKHVFAKVVLNLDSDDMTEPFIDILVQDIVLQKRDAPRPIEVLPWPLSLKITPGNFITVTDDSTVLVKVVARDLLIRLQEMRAHIEAAYSRQSCVKPLEFDQITEGDHVVAWLGGNSNTCARALVKSKTTQDRQISCMNIDTGEMFQVHKEQIFKMDIETASCPTPVLECALDGFEQYVGCGFFKTISQGYYVKPGAKVHISLVKAHEKRKKLPVISLTNLTVEGKNISFTDALMEKLSQDSVLSPVNLNTPTRVMVTHAEKDGCIFVQQKENIFMDIISCALTELAEPEDVRKLFPGAKSLADLDTIKNGVFCIAPYQKSYFRGVVIDTSPPDGDGKVEVYFQDYGNTEIVKKGDAFLMDNLPRILAYVKAQAFKVHLQGVERLKPSLIWDVVDSDTIELVVTKTGPIPEVFLQDDLKKDNQFVSLIPLMISRKIAKPLAPVSETSTAKPSHEISNCENLSGFSCNLDKNDVPISSVRRPSNKQEATISDSGIIKGQNILQDTKPLPRNEKANANLKSKDNSVLTNGGVDSVDGACVLQKPVPPIHSSDQTGGSGSRVHSLKATHCTAVEPLLHKLKTVLEQIDEECTVIVLPSSKVSQILTVALHDSKA